MPLEKRSKEEMLDNALLFTTSSINLLFVFIQILIGFREEQVLHYLILLFIGVFFPFYVGYIRGAIVTDSIIERLRGWVYLIAGVCTYISFFLRWIESFAEWGLLFYLILLMFGFILTRKFIQLMLKALGVQLELSDKYALCGTGGAASVITFFGIYFIPDLRMLRAGLFENLFAAFPMLNFQVLLMVAFFILERTSRNLISYSEEFAVIEFSNEKDRNHPMSAFVMGVDVFFVGMMSNVKVQNFFLGALIAEMVGLMLEQRFPPISSMILLISTIAYLVALVIFLRQKELDLSRASKIQKLKKRDLRKLFR